jgi:capsular exopolysaccharide synthesis family protein
MNQDLSLTNQNQNGDFWTSGPAALVPYAPAAPGKTSNTQSAKPSPMQKIHRLLRGRYSMAITLAAIGAVFGGVGGYMALPPKFESAGVVEVNPIVIGITPGENITPMLTMFIQTEVGKIQGSDVAEMAMKDPAFVDAWQKAYPNLMTTAQLDNGKTVAVPQLATADFIAAVDPEHVKNGYLIRVAFTDKNKQVAEAGCHAVLAAFMALHGKADTDSSAYDQIEYNNGLLQAARKDLTAKQGELDLLAEKYDTIELDKRNDAMQQELVVLTQKTDDAKINWLSAKNAVENQGNNPNRVDKEYLYSLVADAPDREMQLALQERETDTLNLNRLLARYGENAPAIKEQRILIQNDQKRIEDRFREYKSTHSLRMPIDGSYSDVTDQAGVDRLKKIYENLKQEETDLKDQLADVGHQMQRIADTREQLRRLNQQIDSYQSNIANLTARLTLNKPVKLTDPGGEAQVPTDKRKLVAGLGFVFGGFFPLGLMLLYGMSENRFRFSDDANEHDMLGTTLLGILPNLPDRLSDPQQAGVAAHCVHQIRTMLQISRSNDEPQVLAVTSASSGDGKTSLCLALGLSYAACGARTLLVDCDLVAAGLTHRLNVNSTDGVLEAVANRALLEYVRTTDIADVAILPVGTTHAHHASTLSPVALRRLISEGKKHFDIIIIDTGPLLGSIEASLVCAAADRSILAVARNQQRPLVERSIRHLQEIGAHLAGVVFNRAHASDFERSMSGLALRSRPAPGAPVPPFGGKDVTGSFKKKAG